MYQVKHGIAWWVLRARGKRGAIMIPKGNMKAILIDDLGNVQILTGVQALLLQDGREGYNSPMFIECDCGHVLTENAAHFNNGSDVCPICK